MSELQVARGATKWLRSLAQSSAFVKVRAIAKRKFTLRSIAVALLGLFFLTVMDVPTVSLAQTYSYSNSKQTFTVPANVTSITVSMRGGAGGNGGTDGRGSPGTGGEGVGNLVGSISVTPGQVIDIYVGSGGAAGGNSAQNSGGGSGGNN
ncbi:MAG: hypothetical protein RL696_482, partial [Actinomycetota bacterium]